MTQPAWAPRRPAPMRMPLSMAAVVLILTACGQPDPSPSSAPNDGDPQGTWELVEGVVTGLPVPILDGHRITLTIEGSNIGGTAACNTYGGRLAVVGGRLRIQDLLQTMMGCDGPAMDAELLYMGGLVDVDSISLDGDELLLTGPGVDLRFSEVAPPPTAAIVDTVWVLETLVSGEAAASTVGEPATLELRSDGTIHGGTGCRSFDGTWVERGDEIGTPSLAMDDRVCPPDLQDADGHVVSVVGDGFRASVEGNRLTLTDGANGLVYLASE